MYFIFNVYLDIRTIIYYFSLECSRIMKVHRFQYKICQKIKFQSKVHSNTYSNMPLCFFLMKNINPTPKKVHENSFNIIFINIKNILRQQSIHVESNAIFQRHSMKILSACTVPKSWHALKSIYFQWHTFYHS